LERLQDKNIAEQQSVIALPDTISKIYRPATSREVHLWSFGAIRTVRVSGAVGWRESRGTLDDERVFGPRLDYQCACGKYRGPEHERMICDRCGVKVTTSKSRRRRWGHIDFPGQIRHPLGEPPVLVDAFPVLPAAFRESVAGTVLNPLYEDIVRALSPFKADATEHGLEAIVQVVLPILADCVTWNIEEASLFARGVGLVPRYESDDGRCSGCGFPLAGLRVTECPGCGKTLEPR
jgi:hypothetical protein